MPIDKSRLKALLEGKSLVREERDMWMAFGFYMYSSGAATSDSRFYLADGTSENMTKTFAEQFRKQIIEMWETRPSKPAKPQEEKFVHPLDAYLESRNDA